MSDSVRLIVDQNSKMGFEGERKLNDVCNSVYPGSGMNMYLALLNRRMGFGGSLLQNLLITDLLTESGTGAPNKFVADI